MIFGRKKNSPENEGALPPLPQAAHDFLRAAIPAGLSPLTELHNRAAAKTSRALPPSPGNGPTATDRIVEMRIRQWLQEMEKAKTPSKPGISGHSPYYYPPHY